MRLHLLRQPPPTFVERIVGRRGARTLRRRCGFAAVGVGLALLRPKPRYRPTGPVVVLGTALLCVVVAGIVLPIR
jgi:hypothetical protein